MYPTSLALVEDDREYADFLAQHLRAHGMHVDVFGDSNHLLAHPEPYAYHFYVVDLSLPGVDGVELIKVLRQRTQAGVLVVSGRVATDVFQKVIGAGADMYLTKPVQFEHVAIAIAAVQRRIEATTTARAEWCLDRRAGQLVAPDGARVDLSEGDLAVVECFVAANGQVVSREALRQGLGKTAGQDGDDGLTATIYRLRRRIERATPGMVPLQSKSRVGYVFRAPLKAA